MSTPQWVIFRLEANDYALPLARVVEVLRLVAIRPVPEGPAWLAGVINLRGQVLPIMDLRARLGLLVRPARLDTRIIVADVGGADGASAGASSGARWLGLLADEVLEVVTQPATPIELPAALPGVAGQRLLAVQTGDRLVTVFDLDRLSADADSVPLLEAG